MNKKTVDLGFAICLIVSGLIGIIHGVAGIAGAELPDALIRVLGIVSIADLPVLGFFSVWKIKNAGRSKRS